MPPRKTGWQSLQTATGGTFASSDACTSYAAQGGVLFNPKVTVTPTQVAFVNPFPGFFQTGLMSLSWQGFHPNDSVTWRGLADGTAYVAGLTGFTTDSTGAGGTPTLYSATTCGPGTVTLTFVVTDSSGVHATSNPVTADTTCII